MPAGGGRTSPPVFIPARVPSALRRAYYRFWIFRGRLIVGSLRPTIVGRRDDELLS